MALLDKHSCECTRSELDLFTIPGTQTSIESSNYVKIYPQTTLDRSGPIDFKITSGQYIDPASTILFLETRILDKDGNALKDKTADDDPAIPDESICAPINYFHNTQFKNVEVYLNQKLVSVSDNCYSYRSFLETLLTFDEGVKRESLACSLWFKDTGDPDEHEHVAGADRNKGFISRFNVSKFSQTFQSWGRIHSELFSQSKLLLPNTELRLRFLKNDEKFSLMSKVENHNYRIVTDQAYLLVRQCTISDSVSVSHQLALLKENAKYPINKVKTSFYVKGPGRSDLSVPNLVSGTLPDRIVVCLVKSKAFSGSHFHNPFNMCHFNARHIVLRKDGNPVPFESIKLDFTNNRYLEGYLSLIQGTGRLYSDSSFNIRPYTDYKNGYTIYSFDITPDQTPTSGDINLIRDGKLNLEIQLAENTDESVTLIVVSSYTDKIEIDKDGVVYYD